MADKQKTIPIWRLLENHYQANSSYLARIWLWCGFFICIQALDRLSGS